LAKGGEKSSKRSGEMGDHAEIMRSFLNARKPGKGCACRRGGGRGMGNEGKGCGGPTAWLATPMR